MHAIPYHFNILFSLGHKCSWDASPSLLYVYGSSYSPLPPSHTPRQVLLQTLRRFSHLSLLTWSLLLYVPALGYLKKWWWNFLVVLNYLDCLTFLALERSILSNIHIKWNLNYPPGNQYHYLPSWRARDSICFAPGLLVLVEVASVVFPLLFFFFEDLGVSWTWLDDSGNHREGELLYWQAYKFGSLYDCTYPSPKPTLTLTSLLRQNAGLGEG